MLIKLNTVPAQVEPPKESPSKLGPPPSSRPPAVDTCPLEIERMRRQFDERALLVPEVEDDPVDLGESHSWFLTQV